MRVRLWGGRSWATAGPLRLGQLRLCLGTVLSLCGLSESQWLHDAFICQVRLYTEVMAAAALNSGYSSCFALVLHQTMPPTRYTKASKRALLCGLVMPEGKDFIVLKALMSETKRQSLVAKAPCCHNLKSRFRPEFLKVAAVLAVRALGLTVAYRRRNMEF